MIDPRTGADVRARYALLPEKADRERPWPRPLKGIWDGTITLRRLHRTLGLMLRHLGLCEEYFSTAGALDFDHAGRLDATWDALVHGELKACWIACYAVTGTSEGARRCPAALPSSMRCSLVSRGGSVIFGMRNAFLLRKSHRARSRGPAGSTATREEPTRSGVSMTAQPSARRLSIHLVQPRFPPTYWGLEHFIALTPFSAVFPPLGLLTLAALTPSEHRVTVCDVNAGERVDYDTDADVVGVTGYIIQMQSVFEIADGYRARGKTVVIGGPIANLIPELCRPHCDVLFEGEAEYTWPRFLADYAAGRHADRYHEAEKIHLPDSPPPRLDVLRRRYAHGIVQCTRGCPFTCEFCDIIVMYGRKMRFKPVPQVLKEVEAWHRAGVAQVFFADDNFVGNRAYAKELLRALIAWNRRQRHPLSFYTQASIDMVRDDELLGLLRDANFISVFLGIETPRKASLVETKKIMNERLDLVEAVHQIQSYNLFVSAGMIVGFDHDDPAIFAEQFDFLQEAQIPMAMLSVLVAVPRTPLYNRLKAEGRLLNMQGDTSDCSHYVGTAGGTNFHPLQMTREELAAGQERLYQRLYSPEAFAHRLLGNLSRFQDVHYQPERTKLSSFLVLWRILRAYWRQGPAARRFFGKCLWRGIKHSPRLVAQTVIYLGMYHHFCKVHGDKLAWNPWEGIDPKPRLRPPSPRKPTTVA